MPEQKSVRTEFVGRTRAVPIGDHAFLSDGEVSALVAPDGSVSWMCVPRFDSPSVFGSILGRFAGSFRVAPLDVTVPASRRYLPGTMILETSWGTPTGWIIIRDVLLIGPWHHSRDRSATYHRTPTTTRPSTSCSGASVASPARSRWSWTASRSSTTAGGRRTGSTPARRTTRESPAARATTYA